jgi:L-arabinose isomerase
VHEFLSRWCEAGPTHHFALGIGHRVSALKKFAEISGIPLTVIK